jgi:two-component system response regulator AtoC
MKPCVLVVDDEELIRWSVSEHLKQEGFRTRTAANGEEALATIEEEAPDALVLDLKMPKVDGMEVLSELRRREVTIPVVVLTADGGIDTAIEATRLGAHAYLTKPFDLREVVLAVSRVLEDARLRREVHYLRARERGGYGDFVGTASALDPVFETLERLEKIDAPTVLLLGESGTGKDIVARMIHARGQRRDKPFMEIDCASLPQALIESELFGHERGAFTDAHARKQGLFEVAAGGVVFLDELGELPLGTQAKLLRALENRTFRRVGGVANLRMDVALVAATNRNLAEEVRAGRFREDLFFRLNVVPIQLPPLRERREDIPALVNHFLEQFNTRFGRGVLGITEEAMQLLQGWRWPGNVRELRNVLERIVILGPDDVVTPNDLPTEIRFARTEGPGQGDCPFQLPEEGVDLEAVERGLLIQALQRTDGNQSAASRLLGISRYALRYRMEKYGLMEG